MNTGTFLRQGTARLSEVGIATARLDILILLEDALKKDRAHLLANPDLVLKGTTLKSLNNKLERRARHQPLAYIRGKSEFYGRQFKINRHVLEPRPESETMIEQLKKLTKNKKQNEKWTIADVGTGSGALGITAKLEIPQSEVDLYDISSGALAVAKHNSHLHELHLHARKMDLLARPLRPYDIILANLPYVPDSWQINPAAMAEPKIAIFGGKDGLDIYRRFFAQLQHFTWRPAFILCESLPPQHSGLAKIAEAAGFKLHKSQDFIQTFKDA